MSDRNYWQRMKNRQYSRRSLLRASARAGLGASAIALIGCGDDDDGDQQQAAAQVQAQQQQQQQAMQQQAQEEPEQQAMQQEQQQQAAVAQAQQADDGPKMGGRIVAADAATPETFSGTTGPFAVGRGDATEGWTIGMWDCLMRRREGNGGDAEPRLAESWQQNADATATEVTLREGIEFHSGKPINAEAVKATFEVIANVDVSNSSQVRGLIANYLESIEIIDDRTLMFNHPIWPGDIIFDMFHFAQIHDADEIEAYNAVESFGGCSGPFMWDFDQYEPSERYTVVRNENFYRDVYLDAIEVRTIADEDTRALALEAGEIDFATVNPDQYLRLGEMDHLTQLEGPAGGMWVMGPVQTHLGGGHPANDDPRFRLALHKAIDRERLHEDVFQGIGMSTNQMWLSNSPAYDPAFDKDPYDPEGARALVEESGWDGVEMDLFVSNTFSHQVIPEILQANLKDVGINITIVKQEVAEWVDFFLTGTFPGLYVAGTGFFWMAPETLPNMNFQFRFPENAVASVTGEYKRIVEGFGSQPTPAERLELFNDWNELWAEGPWLLPYHTINNTTIVNSRVQGETWPAQIFTFTEEWWVDEA